MAFMGMQLSMMMAGYIGRPRKTRNKQVDGNERTPDDWSSGDGKSIATATRSREHSGSAMDLDPPPPVLTSVEPSTIDQPLSKRTKEASPLVSGNRSAIDQAHRAESKAKNDDDYLSTASITDSEANTKKPLFANRKPQKCRVSRNTCRGQMVGDKVEQDDTASPATEEDASDHGAQEVKKRGA